MSQQNIMRFTCWRKLFKKSSSTIDDNDIEGWIGIRASEGSDATVTRNRVHECETGIRIDDQSRATIEGNTITNNMWQWNQNRIRGTGDNNVQPAR